MSLVAFGGCALERVEIGRYEHGDEDIEPTAGSAGYGWSEAQLFAGLSEVVRVDILELWFEAEVSTTLRILIEVRPSAGGAIPDILEVELTDAQGAAIAGVEDATGLRFDAVLGPGWQLRLASTEAIEVVVEARAELP